MTDERRMTFREHLEELRRRLVRCLVAVGASLLICLTFMREIVAFVVDGPHRRAVELLVGGYAEQGIRIEPVLISGTYQAPFLAYFKLCFIVSLFLASPVVGYQMWKFIGAGLYEGERRWIALFAPFSFLLFIGGCLFGFMIMIPFALVFFVQVADPQVVKPMFNVAEYITLVTLFTLVLGGAFQLPLLMVFFAKIGLAGPRGYLKFWRAAVVAIFVAAALLTPPDPISQLLLAAPLLVLYFLGVGLSALAVRKRPEPA